MVDIADSITTSAIFALSSFPIKLFESMTISMWRLLFLSNIELGFSRCPVKPINLFLSFKNFFLVYLIN